MEIGDKIPVSNIVEYNGIKDAVVKPHYGKTVTAFGILGGLNFCIVSNKPTLLALHSSELKRIGEFTITKLK